LPTFALAVAVAFDDCFLVDDDDEVLSFLDGDDDDTDFAQRLLLSSALSSRSRILEAVGMLALIYR
jgi:hypothetical protein